MLLPWVVSHRGGGVGLRSADDLYIGHMHESVVWAEANAAFIVRACNAHDALVEALREVALMSRGIAEEEAPAVAVKALRLIGETWEYVKSEGGFVKVASNG